MSLSHALAKLEDASGWEGVAHDRNVTPADRIALSQAISLKRIADALDSSDDGGRPQGSVLWWLEQISEGMKQ